MPLQIAKSLNNKFKRLPQDLEKVVNPNYSIVSQETFKTMITKRKIVHINFNITFRRHSNELDES